MRRRALAISLMAVLLVSLTSGCIGSGGGTKTVTVTKTVGPKTESTTHSRSTTPNVTTSSTNTATAPTSTTSEGTINCKENTWRDNFTQALTCALDPLTNHNFNPVFSLSLTGNKTKDALTITDFLVNYVHLDEFTENQSMKKGYYYNIKTPYELFHTKQGTYADMALFGAYALARDGFETYIYYITTKNGFGVLPGFRMNTNTPYVSNEPFVIFWPFRIPIRISAALKLLDLLGEKPKEVTIYRVSYNSGKYQARKIGEYPASKFEFSTQEWFMFGVPNKETMNRLLSRDFLRCKFTFNLSKVSPNPKDVTEINVTFPYGILFYSVPFSHRYTEILYTIMISNRTTVQALTECRFLVLGPNINFDPSHPPVNYTATYTGLISK